MRAALLVLALAACQLHPPPMAARVQHGPAYGAKLTTLLALPAEPAMCEPITCAAVQSATRMTLELAGYTIVDAEQINAEMRRRTTKTRTELTEHTRPPPEPRQPYTPPASDSHSETTVDAGKAWNDAAPGERDEMARTLGADGLVHTTIVAAPGPHVWITRYTIAITLTTLDGHTLWHSECSADSGELED